jgi:hypothetical protein
MKRQSGSKSSYIVICTPATNIFIQLGRFKNFQEMGVGLKVS